MGKPQTWHPSLQLGYWNWQSNLEMCHHLANMNEWSNKASIQHMIFTQNFIEIWFAILTLWLVHCCKTTEKWPMPRVYGGLFSIIFQPTSTKLVATLRDDWQLIRLVCSTFKSHAASSITGLLKDLPHAYLRQLFSMPVHPTPTKFGVNIVR